MNNQGQFARSIACTAAVLAFLGPLLVAATHVGFGFHAEDISGFPTGKVFLTGGGAYDPTAPITASSFVKSAGGFRCLADVRQGPLFISINPDDPGPCLAGEGVRWDTVKLLSTTTFKCTG